MSEYKIKKIDAPIWYEIPQEIIESENIIISCNDSETSISYKTAKVIFEDASDVISSDRLLIRKGARIKTYLDNKLFLAPDGCRDFDVPNSEYLRDTSCWGVVLRCTYCRYDELGRYKDNYGEFCGACFGFPF